jgi:hypothetical protein
MRTGGEGQEVASFEALLLGTAAGIVLTGVAKTLSYIIFPRNQWSWIRTTIVLEILVREIRRRTRAAVDLPDVRAAVVVARLGHVAGSMRATRRYADMAGLGLPVPLMPAEPVAADVNRGGFSTLPSVLSGPTCLRRRLRQCIVRILMRQYQA